MSTGRLGNARPGAFNATGPRSRRLHTPRPFRAEGNTETFLTSYSLGRIYRPYPILYSEPAFLSQIDPP